MAPWVTHITRRARAAAVFAATTAAIGAVLTAIAIELWRDASPAASLVAGCAALFLLPSGIIVAIYALAGLYLAARIVRTSWKRLGRGYARATLAVLRPALDLYLPSRTESELRGDDAGPGEGLQVAPFLPPAPQPGISPKRSSYPPPEIYPMTPHAPAVFTPREAHLSPRHRVVWDALTYRWQTVGELYQRVSRAMSRDDLVDILIDLAAGKSVEHKGGTSWRRKELRL